MKLFLIFLLNIIFVFSIFGQNIKGYIRISDALPLLPFNKTNLDLGIDLVKNEYSLIFGVKYQLMGSFKGYNDPPYTIIVHSIGLGAKIRLRKDTKIYHPIFSSNILTQIHSNYTGRLIEALSEGEYDLSPQDLPSTNYGVSSTPFGSPPWDYKYCYFYRALPLIFEISFQNEFRIYDNFKIDFGVGYCLHYFKLGFKKWPYYSSPTLSGSYLKIKDANYISIDDIRQKIMVQLGISYTFSFKK